MLLSTLSLSTYTRISSILPSHIHLVVTIYLFIQFRNIVVMGYISDIPLSYNFMELRNDPEVLNAIEVGWSNQVEATISIKLNCISTEFTSRKHGGEKGVLFRLQVETFVVSTFQELELVNCAYCLVKIFKVSISWHIYGIDPVIWVSCYTMLDLSGEGVTSFRLVKPPDFNWPPRPPSDLI